MCINIFTVGGGGLPLEQQLPEVSAGGAQGEVVGQVVAQPCSGVGEVLHGHGLEKHSGKSELWTQHCTQH